MMQVERVDFLSLPSQDIERARRFGRPRAATDVHSVGQNRLALVGGIRERVVLLDVRDVTGGVGPARGALLVDRAVLEELLRSGRLLDWQGADQWLFLRTPVKKVVAVSGIGANLGADASLAGWCCP